MLQDTAGTRVGETGLLAIFKLRRFRVLLLLALFGICTLVYYFGQLVDLAGWNALRWEFFYTVHDVHRLLFLAPVVYAGYFFGIGGAVTVTIASLLVFLPRAIFISPFPDPILRAVVSVIIEGVLGYLTVVVRNRFQQRVAKALVRNVGNGPAENKKTEDGVFIAGDLEVDLPRRLVKRRGQVVKFTRTEYELLAYLVSNSGKVLTHRELLHHVWGPEYGDEESGGVV